MLYVKGLPYNRNPFDKEVMPSSSIPSDTDIWAFAYKEDDRAKNLFCKPVLGQLKTKWGDRRLFKQYNAKKTGFTKSVEEPSRYYADTYEEACEGFDYLIEKRIRNLKETIECLEKEKI